MSISFCGHILNDRKYVRLNINPDTGLQRSLCRIKGYEYYGITSTRFGTGTENVRRVDFPSSAYFSLPGK